MLLTSIRISALRPTNFNGTLPPSTRTSASRGRCSSTIVPCGVGTVGLGLGHSAIALINNNKHATAPRPAPNSHHFSARGLAAGVRDGREVVPLSDV